MLRKHTLKIIKARSVSRAAHSGRKFSSQMSPTLSTPATPAHVMRTRAPDNSSNLSVKKPTPPMCVLDELSDQAGYTTEELSDHVNHFNTVVANFTPEELVAWAGSVGPVAMSSSFGTQAAVLLHMATRAIPDVPVVVVDTGYLPKETYLYIEELKELLNLNLVVASNMEWSPARMEAIHGKLWEMDEKEAHQLYGQMRKAEPLNQALDSLSPAPQLLLSGLRASQTAARANMPRVSVSKDGRLKVLPLLKMTDADVDDYMRHHNLPQHPLVAQGYVSVGDWHSSRPLEEGEDARATRFGGKFEECGLHVDTPQLKAETDPVETDTEAAMRIVGDTPINGDTGFATMLVKKKMEDGEWCQKCNDVAGKLEKDGSVEWVGSMAVADVNDAESDGFRLARHFKEEKAPFFVVREEGEAEWRVIYSYGQWKTTLKKAVKARSSQ